MAHKPLLPGEKQASMLADWEQSVKLQSGSLKKLFNYQDKAGKYTKDYVLCGDKS